MFLYFAKSIVTNMALLRHIITIFTITINHK